VNILVTGAAGFVGSALCTELLALGHDVYAHVRPGSTWPCGTTPVACNLEALPAAFEGLAGIDVVVHLAGRAHKLGDTAADPLQAFMSVNRDATVALAKAADAAGVKRFLFISSIGVHGNLTGDQPFTEHSPFAPAADYAQSKMQAEIQLVELLKTRTMELVRIRPPLVYGAQAPGNFRKLLKMTSLGLPLPFGGVRNQRSLISLSNLVSIIALCTTHPNAANEDFVVSDGSRLSIAEISRALGRGLGRTPPMIWVPSILLRGAFSLSGKRSIYEQLFLSLVVDSSKSERLLGWTPRESTLSALEVCAQAFKRTPGKP